MERRRRSNLRALHKYANARAPEEGQMTGGGEGSSGGRDACTCILYTRKGVRSNAGARTRCSGGGEDAAVAAEDITAVESAEKTWRWRKTRKERSESRRMKIRGEGANNRDDYGWGRRLRTGCGARVCV